MIAEMKNFRLDDDKIIGAALKEDGLVAES